MPDAIKIDLTELQAIMDGLPPQPAGAEKRKHALTPDDIIIIAKVVQAVSHKSCAMGFTPDEISTVKRLVGTMNKGILVVGYAIMAAVGAGVVWILKNGIADAFHKGAK